MFANQFCLEWLKSSLPSFSNEDSALSALLLMLSVNCLKLSVNCLEQSVNCFMQRVNYQTRVLTAFCKVLTALCKVSTAICQLSIALCKVSIALCKVSTALCIVNGSKRKNGTTCFANFCQTEGLNYKKFMTIQKLCKRSLKCDVAGHFSFFRLEIA